MPDDDANDAYKISLYLSARWRDRLKPLAIAKGYRTINAYVNALIAKDNPIEAVVPAAKA